MRKFIAILLSAVFICALASGTFAVLMKTTRTVVTTPGMRKTVVVKRYFYPSRTVVIAKKTVVYRPWKWVGRVRVIMAGVVIREHPFMSAVALGNLAKASEYDVAQRYDGWLFVKSDGKPGWVRTGSVKIISVNKNVKPGWGENVQEENVKVPEGEE